MSWNRTILAGFFLVAAGACAPDSSGDADAVQSELRGTIEIDGSSTVYPISEAMAEEFGRETGGGVRVTVGFSGTGGGFKRFCAGETHISNASRPIKDSEAQLCVQNGVEYLELPVAIDGLAVVVNPKNTFAECLTVAELKKIWEPGSRVSSWSQVRTGFPNQPIKLYGPGTNSGTFDYFTEAIMGEEDASRGDYSASEDDNVLVQGVVGDEGALGYFGYAYYAENSGSLKPVAVDDGTGCVGPTPETITSGQYKPLSRPLLIYVNRSALARPEVAAFARFYIEHAPELVPEVGYVARPAADYAQGVQALGQAAGAPSGQQGDSVR
ncbi:MAG TPA: PstS family phosphate ABC transporter substrate-binding protein [Longimicrobiales bacterium]|nr:PstS family phosphate ABC transporter substrate-binding protein [Longimicrobiales bacterium]